MGCNRRKNARKEKLIFIENYLVLQGNENCCYYQLTPTFDMWKYKVEQQHLWSSILAFEAILVFSHVQREEVDVNL